MELNAREQLVKTNAHDVVKLIAHPWLLRNKVWLSRFKKFSLEDGKQLCMNDLGHDD